MDFPPVLIAEDNAEDVELWQMAFTDAGVPKENLEIAVDGASAWGLLLTRNASPSPFDLVIVDQYLPYLSGPQLISKVQAEPLFTGTPIVMVSGGKPSAFDAPYCVWHVKPDSFQDLVALARQLTVTYLSALTRKLQES